MYELKDKEMIFVFTGPNGAGRKTVAEMAGLTLNIKQVLSYTTRVKRHNEIEGQDYYFISQEAFEEAKRHNEFIEVVENSGVQYGIKSKDIEDQLQLSGCIYLILNREGSDILKSVYGDKVKRILIYADKEIIIKRQEERGDTPELIAKYMATYEEEIAYRSQCEHVYENTDLSHTMYDITKTLESYLERDLKDLD